MNAKWYFSALFLIFISLGAFQEQVSIPNQEITLEFVDTKTNKKNNKNTIAEVKEKLLNIGALNINIRKALNGTLKISYYSNFNVADIKKELTKKNTLVLNLGSNHKKKSKHLSNYNIDINELTNDSDISNSDYKYVFEIKYSSDRFTTYNYSAFIKKLEKQRANQLFKTTYRVHKNNPFTKDRTSYKEPEVRAGPKSFFC
jgi:hypothetical protein